jgi:Tfp pilus assembly protein PilV
MHPSPNDQPTRNHREHGFSLIEVLAAAALLAAVIISIMAMFIYGGQHINGGRLMTKATSIATDALEEMRRLNFEQVYQLLEDTRADADELYEWQSDTELPNQPAPGGAFDDILQDWKIQVEENLPEGRMVISTRGLDELGSNPAQSPFVDASLIQVVVTVEWRERARNRSVVFEILKI